MSRFHILTYFLHEAIVNMSRNKLLNSIAIGMIAVSLAIFGNFLLIYNNLNAFARTWTDSIQIVAYLDENVSDDQQSQIEAKIHALESIQQITYISPEDALHDFRQRLGEYEYLLDGLEANPLPASYEIQLKRKHRNLESVQRVVETLQEIQQFDDIQYGQSWLENLTVVINMLKLIGVLLGGFLFLTVMFIISNTIKLTLYAREEELTIMKFIGATESFIKGPFLAEGMIQGFLGAVFSLALSYGIYKLFVLLIPHVSQSLFRFSVISFLSWIAIISMTILGSVLGWCGSFLTLHRFLKTY